MSQFTCPHRVRTEFFAYTNNLTFLRCWLNERVALEARSWYTRACARACVCACVFACARACACVCVHMCARVP